MRRNLSVSALFLLLPSLAHAAAPVCALLDPEKTPQGALLEAKLLADPAATWVERASIDTVLKEQKLQAMFSPQGVGERVRLGKLLKADVLVMVRPVKDAKEPVLEIVISETAGGLRLAIRGVPITKDANADVAAMMSAVKEGIAKHGEKIIEVVAVPPFASNDLEFTYDHMRGALAKLVEAEALDRKGVVVVELEEAQALAKEIALAAPGSKLERPLPVYLLGEYRHEGKGKDRTIALKLRAERGSKPVGKPEAITLKPEASPAAVRKWSAGVLDSLLKDDKPRPPADPKAEAKLLAERARLFRQLGNTLDMLALCEASLLLDPDQPLDVRMDAIVALERLGTSTWNKGFKDTKEVERSVMFYRRGLAHIEEFHTRGGALDQFLGAAGKESSMYFTWWIPGPQSKYPSQRAADLMAELQAEAQATYLRLIPLLAKRGKGDDKKWVSIAIVYLSTREKYELLDKIIADVRDLPDLTNRVISYVPGALYSYTPDTPEYRAFLDRLLSSDNKDLQEAGKTLRAKLDAKADLPRKEWATTGPGPGGVKLTPVALSIENLDPKYRQPKAFLGMMSIGTGVDVLWSRDALYVMKEKGKARLVWHAPGPDNGEVFHSTVIFDGKYVWVTFPPSRSKKNVIFVILDPQTEKVSDLTNSDDLPRPPENAAEGQQSGATIIKATPLEPGRVCLSGSFLKRTWVGFAAFDPTSGKAKIEVIHEARDIPDRDDPNPWTKTTVAFSPSFMFTLADPPGSDGKQNRRVLIQRTSGDNHTIAATPLIVDPDRRMVEVMKLGDWVNSPMVLRPSSVITMKGTMYVIDSNLSDATKTGRELVRFGSPGLTKTVLAKDLLIKGSMGSWLAVHDGRFHILNGEGMKNVAPSGSPNPQMTHYYQWVTVDLDGKNPRLVASGLESLNGVWVSSHYGLVTFVQPGAIKPSILNTVEIVAPNPKK